MRTNVTMQRVVGNHNFLQRTKDGYFNATDLLKQWNECNPEDKRYIDNFWKSTHIDKLMHEIALNELNFNPVEFTALKNKLANITKGKYGGTWMHPLLFIKFAMYLSPSFEYYILKFVSDQLIDYRHDAGDNYTGLTNSVQIFNNIYGCPYIRLFLLPL